MNFKNFSLEKKMHRKCRFIFFSYPHSPLRKIIIITSINSIGSLVHVLSAMSIKFLLQSLKVSQSR